MIFAAILAGGKGTRVGTSIPKQFLNLKGKPVIIWTMDAFLQSNLCDYIYVSVNQMWLEHMEEIISNYYTVEDRRKIKLVSGGKERIMSFLNVIYDIRDSFGIRETDIILSHDAVRPFVTTDIIKDCIEQTKIYKVAMASIQSAETTYAMEKDGFLTSTYNRSTLYLGQTPQGCRMDFMYEVVNAYSEEELLSMTGTSQLFIKKGIDVKVSLGHTDNIKITTLGDVEYAEYKLNKKQEKGVDE